MGKTYAEVIDDLRAEYGSDLDEMIDRCYWEGSGLGVCIECDWEHFNVPYDENEGDCEACFSNLVKSVFVLWEGRKG